MTSDVRIALALAAASSLAVAALFPYLLATVPKLRQLTLPVRHLVLARSLNAGILMFVLAWIGLRLGAPLGLDAPMLRAWTDHESSRHGPQSLPVAAAVGLCIGALIIVLDRWIFLASQPDALVRGGAHFSRWKGLLAAFYGAIVEEVLSRLFLMSVIVWLGAMVLHPPSARLFVAASLLSAVVFAVGHLPAAAQAAPLTTTAVARVIVLNTLAGFAFGILFWRQGFEHAMVAHFSTDLVLHVVFARTTTRFGSG